MSTPTRALVCALGGLLAALALAVPAQAGDVKGACIYSGEAKFQDKNDASLGIRLVGGKGTFSGSFAVACTTVAKGTPDARVVGVAVSGTFSSVVCGHGKATATIDAVDGPLKAQNLFVGDKYSVHHFFWKIGGLYKHKPEGLKIFDVKTFLGGQSKIGQSQKIWHFVGFTRVDPPTEKQPPQPPDASTGNCTKALTVSGGSVIDE